MRLAIALLLVTRSAAADDALGVRVHREATATDPVLELDPVLRPRLESVIGVEEHHERTVIPIGRRAAAVLENTEWANDRDVALGPIDIAARGWRTGLRFTYDLGFATFELHGDIDRVDTRYGSGTYRDLGASIYRTLKLSRWMTGWISLGLNHREWYGQPPPGEQQGETTVMLTIGTTFR